MYGVLGLWVGFIGRLAVLSMGVGGAEFIKFISS